MVDRIRIGYESQLARMDRRLEAIDDGDVDEDGSGNGTAPSADRYGDVQAERELRKLVIATERIELGRLLARRKVSERVAGEVRAALDLDETTMRP